MIVSFRKLLISSFFFTSILLLGCSRHNYYTIESDVPSTKRGFLQEHDSISFMYHFSHPGTMEVTIANLRDCPIYVDWTRCIMTINGSSLSFTEREPIKKAVQPSGTRNHVPLPLKKRLSNNVENGVSQVAPKAALTYRTDRISFAFRNLNRVSEARKITVQQGVGRSLVIDRSVADSFLIDLAIRDDSQQEISSYKHAFWVSEILQTNEIQSNFQKNQFHHSKQTAAGQVLTALGGIAIIFIAAVLEDPNNQ